jgi:hypothetical protein
LAYSPVCQSNEHEGALLLPQASLLLGLECVMAAVTCGANTCHCGFDVVQITGLGCSIEFGSFCLQLF